MKTKSILFLLIAFLGLVKFADPTCDSTCDGDDVEVPEVEFSDCAPIVDLSEIDNLYITQIGKPLTLVTDLAEWTGRLSDSISDPVAPDNIRKLTVIGELAEPDVPEVAISNDRTVNGEGKYSVQFEVDDVSQKNYDFMRKTFCHVLRKIWFSAGGYMYGGNDGIDCKILMKPKITRGKTDPNKLMGVATWKAMFPPERTANPLA